MKCWSTNWSWQNNLFAFIILNLGVASGYTQISYFNNTYDFQQREEINLFYTGLCLANDSIAYIPGTIKLNGSQRANLSVININNGQLINEIISSDTINNVVYSGGGIVNHQDAIYTTGFVTKFDVDSTKPYLFKYRNGQLIFQKEYSFGYPVSYFDYSGLIIFNNFLYVVGESHPDSSSNTHAIVAQLDTNGNVVDYKEFGGASVDAFWSIDTTLDGGFILGGWTGSYGFGSGLSGDAWLVKVDSNLNFQWQKTFGRAGVWEHCYAKSLNDGNYIVYGNNNTASGTSPLQSWMAKLDNNGDPVWQFFMLPSAYNASLNSSYIVDAFPMGNGYFAALMQDIDTVGHFVSGTGILRPSGLFLLFDSNGDTIYSHKLIGRNNDNYVNRMIATPDGGFLINGYVFPSNPFPYTDTQDGWLIKLDDHFCDVDSCDGFDITIGLPPEVSDKNKWIIYPNPASEECTIQFSTPTISKGTIQIVSVNGSIIKTLFVPIEQTQLTISVNDLAPGIYFINYNSGNNEVWVNKLVVAK